MIDTLLKIAGLLKELVSTHTVQANEASLASRLALTLAANYVGDLATGLPHNRNAQKTIAEACTKAGSKLRLLAPELAKEFFDFAEFWSSGAVAQSGTSMDHLSEHVKRLDRLLRGKNLMMD
jgi:hypothetical protein